MLKLNLKHKVILFLIATSAIYLCYFPVGDFNYDQSDKSLCVNTKSYFKYGQVDKLQALGWHIYERKMKVIDGIGYAYIKDPKCEASVDNVRYIAYQSFEDNPLSIIGCIGMFSSSSKSQIYNFQIIDNKYNKKVFSYSGSGCSENKVRGVFYDLLFKEMTK